MNNRIFLSPPHMNGEELKYIHEAFASNYIAPVGPMVDAFEREFAEIVGMRHAVAVSSGTAAMHLALRNLGVGPGDVVLASTLTFIGSISPVLFQGATPVFVDSDEATWNMDPDLLETAIDWCIGRGRRPKAVVPTDLYGQCADYDRIRALCDRHHIPLVVDAAEALGASYKGFHAGNGAEAAVYSFNGNKIMTTSGGGMLAADDAAFIDQARFLSQQARDPAVHYEHTQLGYNYRMSNVLAAIGRGQIMGLDARVARKREIRAFYQDALESLPGITFMPEAPYGRSNCWLTVVLVDPDAFGADRERVRLALEAENIESRPVWKPMHLQPVFESTMIIDGEAREDHPRANLPLSGRGDGQPYPAYCIGGQVSESLFKKGLCLPSGTAMTEADLERVVSVIKRL
jgi:dTDP-4-amino-4,6-dideoxygalactose transaminase